MDSSGGQLDRFTGHTQRKSLTFWSQTWKRNVGECASARGLKDTFDGSAQDKSPCEVDINEGPVDGRTEGRTGVHVEGEVVLKCEGNNNEGACDMLC